MIKINNISKKFGDKIIFENINLEIKSGKKMVILGKSGVGKSTLLKILSGLDKDFSGNIEYYGIKKLPSLEMGFVYQEFDQLFPWLSVKDNIGFPSKEENISRIKKLLSEVDMLDAIGKFPNELSGGMKQRVAILRAIYNKPKILFLDEPFSSLDNSLRLSLQDALLNVTKLENITFVFVTHDIAEAIKISDEIIILRNSDINILDNKLGELYRNNEIDEFSREYIDFYKNIKEYI